MEGKGPCPCYECSISPSPCQTWFRIIVDTACHVVYDTTEAQLTTVDFFYDDEGSEMKSEWALEVLLKDQLADSSTLLCASHDKALCEQLQNHTTQAERISRGLRLDDLPNEAWRLCVVVSHPHGKSKRITLGRGQKRGVREYIYITDTCPGSSGAPVLIFVAHPGRENIINEADITFRAPHREWLEDEELNQSGWGKTLSSPLLLHLKILDMQDGGESVEKIWTTVQSAMKLQADT